MRAIARSGLWALAALAFATAAPAQAPPQARPAARPAAAAAPGANPVAPLDPRLAQVLATVNGEPITRGELIQFLSRYQVPAGIEDQAYHDAMDTLVNTHLINQFLARQRIQVPKAKVDEAIDTLQKQLKQDGNDLPTEMLRSGMTMEDIQREYANRIRWVEYLNGQATDATLQKYVAAHKDLFSGTQVKASHILLKVDPKASAADKEKARQKLLAIKREIEAGKTTFADAANKYSEDPGNSEKSGGDVGYFTLNSGFIEEFADAAFRMKKGAISDPVETPYGFHLIQVTDRQEGKPLDFEQNKPFVKQMYAAELQKGVLASARKVAKIDIKPMPSDLFPPAPAAPANAPAAGPATAQPGTAKAATPR